MVSNIPATISNAIGTAFDGLKSTFLATGKAIQEQGLSIFNFVGDIASKVKTFFIYGLIFVAIIAIVFVAFKAGMFDSYVNKAESE